MFWPKTALRRPRSCLQLMDMRSPTAAEGLLTGEACIVTRTTYNQPPSALLDQGDEFKEDEFEDSDSIRLVRQQFFLEKEPACFTLLPEGHRNKIRAKWDVCIRRFSRLFPRLSVFGNVAHAASW